MLFEGKISKPIHIKLDKNFNSIIESKDIKGTQFLEPGVIFNDEHYGFVLIIDNNGNQKEFLYWANKKPRTLQQQIDSLKGIDKKYLRNDYFNWIITLKGNGKIIGSINACEYEIQDSVLINYAIDNRYINNGCNLETNKEVIDKVHNILSFEKLYKITGTQFQEFNTIYQLYHDMINNRLAKATEFLYIPEYLIYKLTGIKVHELTNASTSGMLDKDTNYYSKEIIELLALRVTACFSDKVIKDIVTVEDIQDSVENVLIQAGYTDVLKLILLDNTLFILLFIPLVSIILYNGL